MIMRRLVHAISPGAERASLPILIFHRVLPLPDPLFPEVPDVRRFRQLLGWVQRWFQVLPLDVAAQQLAQGRLPARALCITFDDGYADNASQALPLLREHGMAATFVIACGHLERGRMWNDSVIEAIRRTPLAALDLRDCGLGQHALSSLQARRSAIDRLLGQIKYLPATQRDQAVAHVTQVAKVPLPSNLMLRSEQLQMLRDKGMQIGAHTVSHPILTRMDDALARWEISHGKQVLELLLQQPVTLFAYPNGKPGADYSADHVAMVREAGFTVAVSTAHGAAVRGDDVLQLPRFTPWGDGSLGFGLRMLGNMRRRVGVVA
jgi:peptidoglycan/xylan/chitin deacetylase (PgdA/CDA1 family)